MFLQEIGDIPHLTVDDDPTVVGGLVLGDLPGRQASLCHCDDTSGENILCACQKSKYPGDASPPRSCPRTLGWCDRDALCAGVPAVDVGTGSTKALERPQKPTVIDDWDPRRLDSTLKRRRIGASGHLRPGFLSARLTHARNCLKPSIQLASTPLCLLFLPFLRKYLPEYLLEYILKHLLKHLSSHLPGRYAIQLTTS